MQKHAKYRNRLVFALGALLATWTPAAATDPKPDDYVARAKQLIRQLYPDLKWDLHTIIRVNQRWREPVSTDLDSMNSFTMELFDIDFKRGVDPPKCWCSAPVLTAFVLFETDANNLIEMSVVGASAAGRHDKFAEEVNKHPEWTDAQVVAKMNAAGARFGPEQRAELLRALPLEELKPYLGGELEVVFEEFGVRYLQAPGKVGDADLSWLVRAKGHGPRGQRAYYNMAFEAFDGRLQTISRLPQGAGNGNK